MSKYYYELLIKPNSYISIFMDLLLSLKNEAIEELENSIIARSEKDLSDVKSGIDKFSKAIGVKCETKLIKKENIDWIKQYKKSVKPIEIGDFYIRPSWKDKKGGKVDIIVDPALSFGSGHHESTLGCIEAINEFVKVNQTVLDVGTGSGILALCTSKLACKVDICDTDDICIKDAMSNFKLNNANFNKSWIGSAKDATKKYDVVLANIVADVLVFIAGDLKKCLNDSAILIISGILNKHLDKVLKKFKDLEQLKLIIKDEWTTIVLKNKGS